MPTISIIVPAYNRMAYLPAAIRSALEQDYPDFEIILIDDGSTGGCREYAGELKDKRIHYHYQEHSGNLSQLRNLGLQLAQGEYLAFLDSDDLWEPTKLRRQWEQLEAKPNLAFSFTDVVEFEDGKVLREDIYQAYLDIPEEKEDMFRRMLSGAMPAYPSASLIRRSAAEEVGGWEEALPLGDTHFLLRLAYRFPGAILHQKLTRIRKHSGNMAVYAGEQAFEEILYSVGYFHEQGVVSDAWNRELRYFYHYQYGLFLAGRKEYRAARQQFGESLWAQPWRIGVLLAYLRCFFRQ